MSPPSDRGSSVGNVLGLVIQTLPSRHTAIILTYDYGPVLLARRVFDRIPLSMFALGSWVMLRVNPLSIEGLDSFTLPNQLNQMFKWQAIQLGSCSTAYKCAQLILAARDEGPDWIMDEFTNSVQIDCQLIIGSVHQSSSNTDDKAGIGHCPLGRVFINCSYFPELYMTGKAFTVTLEGDLPREQNGFCWWQISAVLDVSHLAFNDVNMRRVLANVTGFQRLQQQHETLCLATSYDQSVYAFGSCDYCSDELASDLTIGSRVILWVGRQLTSGEPTRAFFAAPDDSKLVLFCDNAYRRQLAVERRKSTLARARVIVQQRRCLTGEVDLIKAIALNAELMKRLDPVLSQQVRMFILPTGERYLAMARALGREIATDTAETS